MRVQEPPPPLLTVVDPARPAALPGPPPPPGRPPLPARERTLLVLLCVLLGVGLNGARALRAQQQGESALDRLHLSAVVTGGAATLARADGSADGPRVSVEVDLQADDTTDLVLRSLSADRGWRLAGSAPDVLVHGLGQSLFFERQVDCRLPTRPPEHLHLVVSLEGVGIRALEVLVGGGVPGTFPAGPYFCGDLDADQALALVATGVLYRQDHSTVTLALVNASLHPVVVRSMTYLPGFVLVPQQRFPVTLPGRAPGVLRLSRLRTSLVELEARVSDCDAAREGLERFARGDGADLVSVGVSGHGGPGTATLQVRGLAGSLAAVRKVSC